MFADNRCCKFLVMACVAVFLAGALSGCTTLRRKFVRKSKAKDTNDAIIPVLQPEEYAPVVHLPLETYRTHYSTCKAYFSDLWETLGKGESDKRERYIVTQIAAKIDGMAALLKDDKRAEFKVLSDKVLGTLTELDKPQGIRRYDMIKRDLRSAESSLRREYKPDLAKQFLK